MINSGVAVLLMARRIFSVTTLLKLAMAMFAAWFQFSTDAHAQQASPPASPPAVQGQQGQAGSSTLPPIVVQPPAQQKKVRQPSQRRGNQQATQRAPAAQTDQAAAGAANADGGPVSGPQQVASLGKTGTKLGDLPATVQVIPREVLAEQGAMTLSQSITNASGVNVGGQDSLGYFDHFLIRGLNAQIYNDGFSDGDQLGGLSHSLNGVQRIEILNGPGSALFGSGPPGGTINIIHYQPSSTFHWGDTVQVGSFGTVTDSFYVTGPTTINGLDYRVDATVSKSDGFRDLASKDLEIRPEFRWYLGNHTVDFAVDVRHMQQTPDSYGILYLHGEPIKSVDIDAKYSTPFAYAIEDYIRPTITDKWVVADFLTVNNRFSYLYRSLDALRNGDSTRTTVCTNPATQKDPVTGLPCILNQVVGRQLRAQTDIDNTFDYQLEPLWKFATIGIQHNLLTGFEYQHQTMATARTTADLPNIANAFAPVPPETSTVGLQFKCDASHSCDHDRLAADYVSVYATDQMDVTDKLKVRLGVRKDWWDTSLDPLITVPGRFNSEGQPIVAGITENRFDAPVSWNAGALYKLFPGVSPYFGVSQSYLTNFNSENTQNGIGAPESALQYETGIKFAFFNDRLVLNTAAFTVSRDNVAAAVTLNGVETVVFDSQKTDGFEASVDARLTDQWRVIANVTVQNAIVTSNPQGISSVGHHPQGVPGDMANLWSTYKFSIGGISGFQIGAGLNYRDKSYSDITNVNSIPAFVIGNAMIGYEEPTWAVALNLKNFTNERYYIAPNAAGAFVGEPFTAVVSLRFRN